MGWEILFAAGATALGYFGGQAGTDAQAKAAGDAMKAQAKAIAQATAADTEMYGKAMEFGRPFREAGLSYLDELQTAALDPALSDRVKYEMDIGQRYIQRGAAAAGKRESGQTAQDISGMYGNVMSDEYNRKYGRMLDLAAKGGEASKAAMAETMQTGAGLASTYMQGGQTAADYISSRGQMEASNIANLTNLGTSGLNSLATYINT